MPARDISRDTWLWLQLLNLAQAVSDHLCLRAVTYENGLHSKQPKHSPAHPKHFFLQTERDPEDHQNKLKSSIFAASKGKHLSYPLAAAKQFHWIWSIRRWQWLTRQLNRISKSQQELQRHIGIQWAESSVQWPSTHYSRLQGQQLVFGPNSKDRSDCCC